MGICVGSHEDPDGVCPGENVGVAVGYGGSVSRGAEVFVGYVDGCTVGCDVGGSAVASFTLPDAPLVAATALTI